MVKAEEVDLKRNQKLRQRDGLVYEDFRLANPDCFTPIPLLSAGGSASMSEAHSDFIWLPCIAWAWNVIPSYTFPSDGQ